MLPRPCKSAELKYSMRHGRAPFPCWCMMVWLCSRRSGNLPCPQDASKSQPRHGKIFTWLLDMLIWSLWGGSFIVVYFPNTFTRISQEATQFDLIHILFFCAFKLIVVSFWDHTRRRHSLPVVFHDPCFLQPPPSYHLNTLIWMWSRRTLYCHTWQPHECGYNVKYNFNYCPCLRLWLWCWLVEAGVDCLSQRLPTVCPSGFLFVIRRARFANSTARNGGFLWGRFSLGSFFSRNCHQKSTKTRKTDDSSTIFNNLSENERQFNEKTDPRDWLRRRFGEIPDLGACNY